MGEQPGWAPGGPRCCPTPVPVGPEQAALVGPPGPSTALAPAAVRPFPSSLPPQPPLWWPARPGNTPVMLSLTGPHLFAVSKAFTVKAISLPEPAACPVHYTGNFASVSRPLLGRTTRPALRVKAYGCPLRATLGRGSVWFMVVLPLLCPPRLGSAFPQVKTENSSLSKWAPDARDQVEMNTG